MSVVAPAIPGHRHLRLISSAGGYGDVHLYEEIALGRRVAIKVIRDPDVGSSAITQFLAEANTMARLEHPNIVRVYGASQTSDGRPYISMQFCPDDTFERRLVTERLSVAEVLSTGVRIGSAIETAHRAGLLHRDIKPANILKTPFGSPGLTDFGVAHQMTTEDIEGSDVGVSPPWSPPEMLYTSTNGSPASDVYSLAATLWHLLVGRSPFEIPGGDNSTLALMGRIRDLPPPATHRADVPESLERVLRHAMAKRPEQRPRSMGEFIRNLQSVEMELHLQATESVVLDAVGDLDDDRGSTWGPSGSPVSSADPTASGTQLRPRSAGPSASRRADLPDAKTQLRPGSGTQRSGSDAGTAVRPRVTQVDVPLGDDPVAKGRHKVGLFAAGVVLVLAAAAGGVALFGRSSSPSPTPAPTAGRTVDGGGEDSVPPGPVTVKATRDGQQVTFTWDYSARLSTDEYRWQIEGGATGTSKEPKTVAPAAASGPVCLKVIVVRRDGSNPTKDWSAPACA